VIISPTRVLRYLEFSIVPYNVTVELVAERFVSIALKHGTQ